MLCLFVDFFRFCSLITKGVSATGYFNESDPILKTLQQNPAKQDESKPVTGRDELKTSLANRKRMINTEYSISNNQTEIENEVLQLHSEMRFGLNETKIVIKHTTAVFVIVVSITLILVVGYIFRNVNIF